MRDAALQRSTGDHSEDYLAGRWSLAMADSRVQSGVGFFFNYYLKTSDNYFAIVLKDLILLTDNLLY